MKHLDVKVAGVTYENRQAILAGLAGGEPCQIVPEPDNPYDKNALAVHVATSAGVVHIGYIPKSIAAEIAPYLEGETVMCDRLEITGGFEISEHEIANYGARLRVSIPDAADGVVR